MNSHVFLNEGCRLNSLLLIIDFIYLSDLDLIGFIARCTSA